MEGDKVVMGGPPTRENPNYVQNMIENMILTSCSHKSYLVACLDGYVPSIQMMSRDKLKHQVRQHFCGTKSILVAYEVTLHHDSYADKSCNIPIFGFTTSKGLRHATSLLLSSGILSNTYYQISNRTLKISQ